MDRPALMVTVVPPVALALIAYEIAGPPWDAMRISGLVLIDSTDVEIAGQLIRDFFALDARGVAEYALHDAGRFYVDPATVPAESARTGRPRSCANRFVNASAICERPAL